MNGDPHFRTFVVQQVLCNVVSEIINQYFNEKPEAYTSSPVEEEEDEAMFADMNAKLYKSLWLMNQSSVEIESAVRIVVPIQVFITDNLSDARDIYQDDIEGEHSEVDEDENIKTKLQELADFISSKKTK